MAPNARIELGTVGHDGTVALPVAIRRALGLRGGDSVAFVVEDGRILLQRADDALEPAAVESFLRVIASDHRAGGLPGMVPAALSSRLRAPAR